jgi:hypothetical protein
MNETDQVKTFQGMADVSRKWVTTLDTKAGFLVAVNGALLGFIWGSAKLPGSAVHWVKSLAYVSSGLAFFSIFLAMLTVFPRIKLEIKPTVKPVTFYGFVAGKYAQQDGASFVSDVLAMSDADLAREALEQHHAICHVAMLKNTYVIHAAFLWFASFIFAAASVICNGLG